jgi:hypothetical protein
MEYWQLLKSPQWQQKRLEKLSLAGWECQNCGSKDKELHVHHKQYFKGRNPWEYENDQLEVLCDKCHTVQHESLQCIKEIISLSDANEIYNLLVGYSDVDVIKRTTQNGFDNFCPEQQVCGVVARLMQFVPLKKYKKIAEFLIENSSDHLKDDAENFFRQNFPMEVDYD